MVMLATTNRTHSRPILNAIRTLGPERLDVFAFVSNELANIYVDKPAPRKVRTYPVHERLNYELELQLAFAQIEGSSAGRFNLITRLLEETETPERRTVGGMFHWLRFPPEEQVRVLEQLSRDGDQQIQTDAISALAHNYYRSPASLELAVSRLNELILDTNTPTELRGYVAWLGLAIKGNEKRFASATFRLLKDTKSTSEAWRTRLHDRLESLGLGPLNIESSGQDQEDGLSVP